MTKQEQELSKLLDEKLGGIATDISAMEARVAAVEDKMVTRVDLVEIRDNLRKLEKRLTAVEGQLAKTATKKDLEAMEKRLMARFDGLFNYLDKDVMENRMRMDKVDERLEILENQFQAAIGWLFVLTRYPFRGSGGSYPPSKH
jgi:hypothetical protein